MNIRNCKIFIERIIIIIINIKELQKAATLGTAHVTGKYEGWNFNSGNYLFTSDTK